VEKLRLLLEALPELVHVRDKEGSTGLHLAAWRGHPEAVELLLDKGADIHGHSENPHWGTTALHAAAHGNQKEVAEVLIRRGADVNAVKTSGSGTPLAETRVHNATKMAKLLRQAGAVE
jgi:ankyrin repeat protein